eukprot:TRINITY_DN5245_c0_g1_i2.p1 TRINITY_DN5245_c0_g1~~TRINITY_DN5245_c0_g1_i2.p1  ORF type:complete len:178 (+),score=8.53 TRINITY_DN5245_c0_g1_i2:455-988(+)
MIFLFLHSCGLAYKFTLSSDNSIYTIYIALFINGLFSGIVTVIPTTILGEAVHLVQKKFDIQIQGIGYSFKALCLKIGFAFAQLVVTYSLELTGYTPIDSNSNDSSSDEKHQLNDSTLFAIRFICTYGIICMYIFASIFATLYTLYVKYRCKVLTIYSTPVPSEDFDDSKEHYSNQT